MTVKAISANAVAAAAVTASPVTAKAVNDSGGGGGGTYYQDLASLYGHVYYLDDLTASSTAVDSVGGINGTYVGTVTKEQTALSGGEGTSVLFGSNGYVNIDSLPAQLNSSTGTVEFTIDYTGPDATNKTVVSYGDNLNNNIFTIAINTSGILFCLHRKTISTNQVTITTDAALSVAKQHIAVRQNGSGIDFFVDGSPVAITRAYGGTAVASDWWDESYAVSTGCRLGSLWNSTNNVNFLGDTLDNFAITTDALSDAQILANATKALA